MRCLTLDGKFSDGRDGSEFKRVWMNKALAEAAIEEGLREDLHCNVTVLLSGLKKIAQRETAAA